MCKGPRHPSLTHTLSLFLLSLSVRLWLRPSDPSLTSSALTAPLAQRPPETQIHNPLGHWCDLPCNEEGRLLAVGALNNYRLNAFNSLKLLGTPITPQYQGAKT